MRIYDPRLGRFLSVDPLTPKYPELTPYQFASNRPIDGIDLDGLEFYKPKPGQSPSSLYRLLAFHLDNNYVWDDVWKTNLKIHNEIMMQHPDDIEVRNNSGNLESPDKEPEVFTKKRSSSGRAQARLSQEVQNAKVDAVGNVAEGLEDFVKWVRKVRYYEKNSKTISYGIESMSALNESTNLALKARQNPTFPSRLKDEGFIKDVINMMTDLTEPSNASKNYVNLVKLWSTVIYNSKQAVDAGFMDFRPETIEVTIFKMFTGEQKPIVGPVGNPNSDVKAANDALDKYPSSAPVNSNMSEMKSATP